MLVAENNRLRRALIEVRPRIQSHITWLEQELHVVDTELRRMIRRSPALREQDELLHSVPGVGRQACLTLLGNPRKLARWIANSWPRWAEWLPTIGTAVTIGANGSSGAADTEAAPAYVSELQNAPIG